MPCAWSKARIGITRPLSPSSDTGRCRSLRTRRRRTPISRSFHCAAGKRRRRGRRVRHAQRAQHRPRAGASRPAGLDRRNFEFQMLYGMADPIKAAVLQLDCRLREYCPVGELLPGMAYLVRRLLENTSNEGFPGQQIRQRRQPRGAAGAIRASGVVRGREPGTWAPASQLRRRSSLRARAAFHATSRPPISPSPPSGTSCGRPSRTCGGQLGQRHPLVINHKPVSTRDWLPSLNPANQKEVIGYAAQADVAEAEAALAAARAAQPTGRACRRGTRRRAGTSSPR